MTDVNMMLPIKTKKRKRKNKNFACIGLHPSLRHLFLLLIQPGRMMRGPSSPSCRVMFPPPSITEWSHFLNTLSMSPWKHTDSSGWRGVLLNPWITLSQVHICCASIFVRTLLDIIQSPARYMTSQPNGKPEPWFEVVTLQCLVYFF